MSDHERPPVLLHTDPVARAVVVGGDDEPEVRARVEAHLARRLGAPAALVLTGSCSLALDAAAAVLGVGPGDEVVVPAYTFPTTAGAFAARGARLRFADVDPATGSVRPDEVRARIGERTVAVVAMHYAGIAAEVEGLAADLAAVGIALVEDAAQGIGAELHGRPLGTLGRLGASSFHRTKNLSAVEGGALVVNDPADVDAALVAVEKGTNRVAFERGAVAAYEWSGPGSTWRMPEAAVRYLDAELGSFDARQARRHEVWARYEADLPAWAHEVGARLPVVPDGRAHPAHLWFVVLPGDDDRERFVAHCRDRGVQAARHYGSLPDSAYGSTLRHPDDDAPVARELERRLVRIPLHHDLGDDDVDRVVDAVTTWR